MENDTTDSWEWEFDDDGDVISSKEFHLESPEDIVKSLQKRRKNGGCSAHRDIGLKWISDNERWDLLKYQWEKDYIDKHYRKLNEKKLQKLDLDITDNPFTDDVETNDDEYAGFDDPDERLDDNDWEDINNELERMGWKDEKLGMMEYFQKNEQAIERGFYCYVIGCMDKENLESYMDGYRNLIKDYLVKSKHKELPKEIRHDEVTMDFKKEQIEREAERLSNEVMEDLFLLMNHQGGVVGN